jgi:hypothetical protein
MEEKSQPQGPPQGQPQTEELLANVTAAFNLGVSARQKGGNKSVGEVVGELGDSIYGNLRKTHGAQFQEEYILANTEYLLQIALLGFIIPSICAYDEEFKTRLFSLIMAKLERVGSQQPSPKDKNIIVT